MHQEENIMMQLSVSCFMKALKVEKQKDNMMKECCKVHQSKLLFV